MGAVLYFSNNAYDSLSPLMDFFRSIPATALFPLFLLFFGISDLTHIALSVWICSLYFALYVSKGLRGTSEGAVVMAKTLKKNCWEILFHVRFKEALPVIFVGIRTIVTMTIIVILLAEMFVGTKYGLGKFLMDSAYAYNIPQVYAGILAIGLIGYLLSLAVELSEKRFVHWQGK